MINITKKEASLYLLRYQNLYNPRQLKSDEEILRFIQKIGCIQYDPLSKIARNADLLLQSRCKNYTEETLYRLLYEKRELIDGWEKDIKINQDMTDTLIRCFTDFGKFLNVGKISISRTLVKKDFKWIENCI